MWRPQGGKNKYHSQEEKLVLVKRNLDGESVKLLGREAGIAYSLIAKWKRQYLNSGAAALENKKKPGNPLARYSRRKFLTREETLEYKIELLKRKLLKQEAEIVRLKKINEQEGGDIWKSLFKNYMH